MEGSPVAGEQEGAVAGGAVEAREGGELGLEVLKGNVFVEPGDVGGEEDAGGGEVVGSDSLMDQEGGGGGVGGLSGHGLLVVLYD